MIKYQTFILLEGYETNTYLVWDTISHDAILIDPGAQSPELCKTIREMGLNMLYIYNTHGHGDHIGGNLSFHSEFSCPIAIHESDAHMLTNAMQNLSAMMNSPFTSPPATTLSKDGDIIALGENAIKVIHTPGHTKGSVVLYAHPYLFSGDTIFSLSVGRTDLPTGNTNELIQSIRTKIFALPDDTIILPGHGPSTTVAREKKQNPYV
jgi:glyoxylase-like metal-dependent hydrolase (beta-lactamase superfamily II)